MSNPPDDLSSLVLSKLMDGVIEYIRQRHLFSDASGNSNINNTRTDEQDQTTTDTVFGVKLQRIPLVLGASTSHVGGTTGFLHGSSSDGGVVAANTMDARIGSATTTVLDNSIFDREGVWKLVEDLPEEEFWDLLRRLLEPEASNLYWREESAKEWDEAFEGYHLWGADSERKGRNAPSLV